MTDSSLDAGVIQTLLDRLNSQRLPRALEIKNRVDAGEVLDDYDMRYLDDVFADARKIEPLVKRHPEYQALVSRVTGLYREILDKAMENEKKA